MTDYTYSTGNPIGSTDVRDGVDNLISFDVMMNSQDDTYQDRLGNTVPTAKGAIKRLGPVVTAWTFTTGGTLNYPNEAALNPADGNYYGWVGSFPKVVVPGTDPTAVAGYVPRTDVVLRGELASDDGDSFIGIGHERNQKDKNSDVISVLDEGAKADSTTGTDGTDSTSAFLDAITKCKSTGKSLSIPDGHGGYRLTQTIDFRGVHIMDNNATLYVNHAGVGVVLGGNSSNDNNPTQHLGTALRPSANGVGSQTSPDIRVIGAKGQNIHVMKCVYMQLFADTEAPNRSINYSIAYSNFYLKNVAILELLGLGVPGDYGWINENQFYINRPDKILFAAGGYHHNHNKFYNGNYETAATIDLQVGSSNYFYGGRFERNGAIPTEILTINFAQGTRNNIVEATWMSSIGYQQGPYNPANSVHVTDAGYGNVVHHAQDLYSDEVPLFSLSQSTSFVSSVNSSLTGTLSYNTDIDGVRCVQHLVDGRFKILNNFQPLLADGRVIPMGLGDVIIMSSDAALFRPHIYVYDANGVQYVNEPPAGSINSGWLTWVNGAYSSLANGNFFQIIAMSSAVSGIRVGVITGGATAGLTFKSLSLTMRAMKRFARGPRRAFEIQPIKRKSALTYFNDSDINMANIAEGIPCYKTNMAEMKINLMRQRYVVLSVSGNVVTVSGGNVQHFDGNTSLVAYTTAANDNATVAVSSVSGVAITLVSPPPSDIAPGVNIDFIVSKTKVMA